MPSADRFSFNTLLRPEFSPLRAGAGARSLSRRRSIATWLGTLIPTGLCAAADEISDRRTRGAQAAPSASAGGGAAARSSGAALEARRVAVGEARLLERRGPATRARDDLGRAAGCACRGHGGDTRTSLEMRHGGGRGGGATSGRARKPRRVERRGRRGGPACRRVRRAHSFRRTARAGAASLLARHPAPSGRRERRARQPRPSARHDLRGRGVEARALARAARKNRVRVCAQQAVAASAPPNRHVAAGSLSWRADDSRETPRSSDVSSRWRRRSSVATHAMAFVRDALRDDALGGYFTAVAEGGVEGLTLFAPTVYDKHLEGYRRGVDGGGGDSRRRLAARGEGGGGDVVDAFATDLQRRHRDALPGGGFWPEVDAIRKGDIETSAGRALGRPRRARGVDDARSRFARSRARRRTRPVVAAVARSARRRLSKILREKHSGTTSTCVLQHARNGTTRSRTLGTTSSGRSSTPTRTPGARWRTSAASHHDA